MKIFKCEQCGNTKDPNYMLVDGRAVMYCSECGTYIRQLNKFQTWLMQIYLFYQMKH